MANRLHHPRPLRDIEDWAEVCGIEELYGLKPEHLNDDRLGRALEDLEQYFEEINTALAMHVIIGYCHFMLLLSLIQLARPLKYWLSSFSCIRHNYNSKR